jgi:nucleoside-diphosphate-sugar epimerase
MSQTQNFIATRDDRILVTGAAGFIGSKVIELLLHHGFRTVRCLTRSLRGEQRIEATIQGFRDKARVEILRGNLLSREDCTAAAKDVAVVFHLAAGKDEKSVPAAFLNSVVTTRNLLEATLQQRSLKRFVNISSFVVYDVARRIGTVLDESCPVEDHAELISDAYDFAKVKQDELVRDYSTRFHIPVVMVRPGYVYGPGRAAITGRVGIGTFGYFLHLGGPNKIPLTFVDNCAEAIVLTGLMPGIEGEVFNIVDDDLPTSRNFLRLYKKNVRRFRSLYLPHIASYVCCWAWERYSCFSNRQLPSVFNRKKWYRYWKKTDYSNDKLKMMLGWRPAVLTSDALARYFEACRCGEKDA